MAYVPYTGPAGPTPPQIEGNDLHIMDLLQKEGFTCEYKMHTHSHMDPFKMVHVIFKGGILTTSYDRYGYCAEILENEDTLFQCAECIDQGTPESVINWCKEIRDYENNPED